MVRRLVVAVTILMVAATMVTSCSSSDSSTAAGPCDLGGLALEPSTSTADPAGDLIVKVSVSNTMSGADVVMLTVTSSGEAVAGSSAGPVGARLDMPSMGRLSRCLAESGFDDLEGEYLDQSSPRSTNGRFCGISDASVTEIEFHSAAGVKTVAGYALGETAIGGSEDSCNLGHPVALRQVCGGLTDLIGQVVAVGSTH